MQFPESRYILEVSNSKIMIRRKHVTLNDRQIMFKQQRAVQGNTGIFRSSVLRSTIIQILHTPHFKERKYLSRVPAVLARTSFVEEPNSPELLVLVSSLLLSMNLKKNVLPAGLICQQNRNGRIQRHILGSVEKYINLYKKALTYKTPICVRKKFFFGKIPNSHLTHTT